MPLVYKTLFEVKLLHEFYVTNEDGTSPFDLDDQQDRLNFLREQYMNAKESISSDLSFEFPQSLAALYAGYSIKLLPAYSGFKVLIRVNQKVQSDGSVWFTPFASLPNDLSIHILFTRKGNAIDTYTGSRIDNRLPAIYCFSNRSLISQASFPYLPNPVPVFRTGYEYEQGELVSFGTNDIRAFYQDDSGDQWSMLPGGAFMNENDRLLVPGRFEYRFPLHRSITEAEFILNDQNGDIVTSKTFHDTEPFRKVSLDFSDKITALSIRGPGALADSIFTLQVNGNDGYINSHPLIFNNAYSSRNTWAVADINITGSDSDFNLLDEDGFLWKRKNPLGVWDEAPVFEIPVKSRFAFWRYINDRGKELKLTPELDDYLVKDEGALLSKQPRRLTKSYFLFPDDAATQTRFLPNGIDQGFKLDSKSRVCYNVPVPKSELFPVV